jgi:SAM-dependent methyltransferase
MNMKHTEIIANDWNLYSEKYYKQIYPEGVVEHIIADPMWAFPEEVRTMLTDAFSDLRGKRVLVPSSGDNGAVFAFHLLGARVTSADIAKNQLANAKRIADAHGWNIEFVHDDSMKLEHIRDSEYDLVYTSNGVYVWINDLAAMYANFRRVLKPGGRYIMFETHPFIRPFDDNRDDGQFVVIKPYEDVGPFLEVPVMAWRIMDISNAMLDSGLAIRRMVEFHSQLNSFDCWWYNTVEEAEADDWAKHDWKRNPFAALPQWIGFSTVKS